MVGTSATSQWPAYRHHIREMILAHAKRGMEGVYDVSTCLEYQDEMKEALEAWQTRLLGLVGDMK